MSGSNPTHAAREMIAEPVAMTARHAELRLCALLERASRWSSCLAGMAAPGGTGVPEIAARLRGRSARVHGAFDGAWPALRAALLAPSGEIPTELRMGPSLAAAERELAHLERSLAKLPGGGARSELDSLLAECGPHGALVPPVVLGPDERELDDDGFLALPICQGEVPLAWPALGFGLAAARATQANAPADAARCDAQAVAWFGPSYLFALLGRGLGQPAAPDLGPRLAAVRDRLAARGLLVPEATEAIVAYGLRDEAAPVAAPPEPPGRAFDAGDLAAAEVAAARLADGVLASGRPTADRHAIRAERDRLLADPAGGPAAVYAALEGLREEPLTGAQILAGGWLTLARGRPGWLREAAGAADPFDRYGQAVLQLDALVLKSLETASVHRRLVSGR